MSVLPTLKYKRIFTWLVLVFVVMFLFRLLYGYKYSPRDENVSQSESFLSQIQQKNYASERKVQMKPDAAPIPTASSQKYEKVAYVKSRSASFTEDEKQLHGTIRRFGAIIQYQQESGNKGNRDLRLLIGVSPEKFDSCYYAVQKIGTIRSTSITKVDKTNEYRKLNASKVSMEKNLASLNSLTSQPGKIDERILLHERIAEVERQLQELGVELGNFDEENEFCTIQFSMYEGAALQGIPFYSRLKTALEWTVKYYVMLMAGLCLASLGAWLLLKVLTMIKT
ncbi:DUF4349 domain-containing protein [Chitinophaga oryzae]|uniref:DUF4349 domain-containing protein n=1 Tax=Chitinophaga oryzae TaxID=2725414 RepID=A0AAE6ZM18_9BACT|nr:DUF4349 domain-containing protein [Chitinophaga oryzae]QJB35219.1 DUF4349 domain-containing protein [Chitinophaga oryzae]QJB41755.1 DUF4349 domain-containing protein [Chitinophaga oryzae]